MQCNVHPRYKGATAPSKRTDKEGRTCKECWIVHYEAKGIPYNPQTLRSLAKAHTRYYQKNGNQVQGVTTVISNQNGDKGGMVYAAWKLGLEGLDYKEEWRHKADAGTVSHEMVRAHLLEIEWNPALQYGQIMVEQSTVAFNGFLDWKSQFSQFEPILIEHPLVSEVLPYGATLDFYGLLDGLHTLVDFKTGKEVYWNHVVQLAAQKMLLIEHDYPVDRVIGLHIKIGQETTDGVMQAPEFRAHEYKNLDDHCAWFELICRANPYFLRIAKGWR